MVCGKCGRILRDPESILRGYGPVCYGKIAPELKKIARKRKYKDNYDPMSEPDLQIPGQMELSDFIDMNEKGGCEHD